MSCPNVRRRLAFLMLSLVRPQVGRPGKDNEFPETIPEETSSTEEEHVVRQYRCAIDGRSSRPSAARQTTKQKKTRSVFTTSARSIGDRRAT